MACSDNQQPNFKHFCKICKKGFMCGRALGGHMRAHGVGDETMNLDDDDDDPSDDGDGNQRVYALRTNHNRFRRFCENCGKEFLSWKSFLEHGKCGSEDGETSLVWSQETDNDDDDDDEADVFGQYGGGSGLYKRKRSVRVCSSSANEEDITLAKCLMALSNNSVDLMEMEQEGNLKATTNNKDEPRRDIFEPVLLQSSVTRAPPLPLDKAKGEANTTNLKGMFQCKACKKVFSSHQALGGHRASHKNVKGCFASRNDQFDDNLTNDQDVIILDNNYKATSSYQSSHGLAITGPASLAGRKAKEHKCSICYRTFASGQALGGHKRCHWITSNYTTTNSSETTSISKLNFHQHIEQLYQRALAIPKGLELNLNLSTTPPNNTNDTTHDNVQIPIKSSEVSTEINLHAWTSSAADQENGDGNAKDHHEQHQIINVDQDDGIAATTMEGNVDEEDQSKAKLAKLGDLKDTNGDSSSWLQVGIGSITDVAPDL
uniref:uncharacterized protein LOC122601899 n=1 Tax=Erigeron canadensis TaxID=72917 RepID=UPI001CB8BFE0|nr:uncharacterized protein LOC122601899 [Erigeron canadensis]